MTNIFEIATEFIELESRARKTRKFTIEEIKEIIKEYKLKIKQYETN